MKKQFENEQGNITSTETLGLKNSVELKAKLKRSEECLLNLVNMFRDTPNLEENEKNYML